MHHPSIIGLATAVPSHVVQQQDVKRLIARLFADTVAEDARLLDVFQNSEIETRHLCVPIEWLVEPHSFGEKNRVYVENAVALGETVARSVLARTGLTARDIDHLVFVSSTGLATPSIDAMLANRLDMRTDVRRTPIWGLGCAGGAIGVSRAREFALADPSARVLLIALELCSATFQPGDVSKRNLVAASLFADGAAACVVAGRDARLPGRDHQEASIEIVASRSVLWKDSLDVMGWEIDGDGLHVVFSRDIPAIVRERVRPALLAFLDAQGLGLDAIDHVVAPPRRGQGAAGAHGSARAAGRGIRALALGAAPLRKHVGTVVPVRAGSVHRDGHDS